MAMYRCASCGSPNVMLDTQSGGVKYDYVKGAIGTVILGAGGAVAGIENISQKAFKCPDCGMTLSYSMPEEIKVMIDLGVVSADARKRLTLHSIPMEWDYLVKRYKNIESGRGDVEAKKRPAYELEEEALVKLITQRVIEKIPELQTELALFALNNEENGDSASYYDLIKESQKEWEQKVLPVLEKKEAARVEATRKIYAEWKAMQEEINAEMASKTEELDKKHDLLRREKDSLNAKLISLGFFKFAEKKETQERLAKATTQLAYFKEEKERKISKISRDRDAQIQKNVKARNSKLNSAHLEIEEKYPIEESPMHKFNKETLLNSAIYSAKNSDAERGWEKMAQVILFYAINALEENCNGLPVKCDSYLGTSPRNFGTRNTKTIVATVLPEMCKAFGISGKEMIRYGEGLDKYRTNSLARKIIEDLCERKKLIRVDAESYSTTNV